MITRFFSGVAIVKIIGWRNLEMCVSRSKALQLHLDVFFAFLTVYNKKAKSFYFIVLLDGGLRTET